MLTSGVAVSERYCSSVDGVCGVFIYNDSSCGSVVCLSVSHM